MSSIQTSIQLYDGASAVLRNITNAVSKTTQQFDDMNDHFDDAFDESSFNSAKNGFNTINILVNKIENNIDRSTTTQQAFTQQVNKSTQAESEMLSRMKSVESTVNKLDDGIRQANVQQQSFNSSLNVGNSAGGNLLNKIKGVAAAYLGLQGAKNVLGASDGLSQTTARLNLIKEEGQTMAELQDKIFNSAERSRSLYTDTAASVSKLGLLAGKAFSNNDEIIAFTELMNKNFIVGGAAASEQASAMYQLTQAMASGKLQGDEYRSIIENAPLLAKSIEDYMINVKGATGSMKDWSAEGLMTSEVIKAALFKTGDEIEKRLGGIPITWANVANSIKNYALIAFQPILTMLSEIANSNKFLAFKNNLITAFQSISNTAMDIFNVAVSIVNFFSDNWTMIEPIIWGVVAAYAAWKTALLITTALLGFQALASGISGAAKAFEAKETFTATAAQYGFNAALLACPLTWIILSITALIVIFYAAVAAVNHFAGTSYSATGMIVGAFLWMAALIGNVVIGTINSVIQYIWTRFVEPFISIIEWVLNVANGGFDSFGGAVANLIGQIISWFLSLGKVVTKIIDAIFGTNWTDGLSSLQDTVLEWGKNEDAITLDRNAPGIDYRFNYGDAWDKGYEFGDNLSGSAKNLLNSSEKDDQTTHDFDTSNAYNNIAKTADNTGKMKDSINISDEDLKYFHDVAEREAINRFTTAEIKVDMTNHNTVNGTQDLDGIVSYLRDAVEKEMSISAEGVG